MDSQVHKCYGINEAGYAMNGVHHIHMQLKQLFVRVIIQGSGEKRNEMQLKQLSVRDIIQVSGKKKRNARAGKKTWFILRVKSRCRSIIVKNE